MKGKWTRPCVEVVVGPLKGINLIAAGGWNALAVLAVAKVKNKDIEDVVATILNRERHEHIIAELRETGARIKLINDGDIAGAINTVFDKTGVNILFGSGGAPEALFQLSR